MNTRGNLIKGMVNDLYDYSIESYSEKPVKYTEIFDVEDSEGSYEEYTSVVGPGKLARVVESETIPSTSAIEGYTSYCANFKDAVKLPLSNEAIDDNRKIKNFLKTWAQGLGSSARIAQEDEHADLFNYGGYTAGHATFLNDISGGVLTTSYGNKVYDGKPLWTASDNNRSSKSGETFYNGIVLHNLNETTLQTLFELISVTNAFDEAGKRIDIVPDTILTKFGSPNWFTARRIMESVGSVDGAHSGIENVWKDSLNVIGWSALSNKDAWFVGCAKKGLKSLARLPLSIDYYENKEEDGQIVRARIRFGRCVTNWRYWVGANFLQS